MTQRPHAALIKAWADGAVIQYRACPDRAWQDSTNNSPSWVADCEYRIKPEPTPTPEIIVPIALRTETGLFIFNKDFRLRQGDKVDITLVLGARGYDTTD